MVPHGDVARAPEPSRAKVGSSPRRVGGVRAVVERYPALSFFVLAYAFSWAWWAPMAVQGSMVRVGSASPTHFPGLLGPAIAAIIVAFLQGGSAGVRDLLRRMWRWPRRSASTVFAVAFPLLALVVVMVVMAALGRPLRLADLGVMNGLPMMSPVVMLVVLTVWNGLGEETGWRGFALPHLQNRFGPLRGTLVLALAWAGWHIPTFFILETYRSLGLVMVPGFVLGLAAGAVLLTWLYNRTGGSILAVALWHGSFNLVSATRAAQGVLAAVVSTAVMVWGVGLVVAEVRARRGGSSVLA